MGRHRHGRRRGALVALLLAIIGVTITAGDAPPLAPPFSLDNGLVINVPQRILFVLQDGSVVARYPVAVGRKSSPTFVDAFTVVAKAIDPVWHVPPSIQDEQRRAGKTVLTRVPPGPANPLGRYWIGLSVPGYGIHGTNAPDSIGKFTTHGCIRLRAADITALYAHVPVGTEGMSIYEPILVGVSDDAIWLEAHRDVYALDPRDPLTVVIHEVGRHAGAPALDVDAARRVLATRDGRPHRVDAFSTS